MELRDVGLVVELYGNFTGGTLSVEGNHILNAQVYLRDQSGAEVPNHCEKLAAYIDPE
jgi:hypothetical protein